MELTHTPDFTVPEPTVQDYIRLLKPRVMSLVVFTGMVGMYLAPGTVHPLIAVLAILCIALGSGAAGAVNMWYERDIDAIMRRTQHRPIPAGRIAPEYALDFAVICAGASVFLMAVTVNYLAAGLLLAAILFYVFIYTIWLKQRTPMNIVIGGAAGAFPPIIGWAAAMNSLSWEPVILFVLIFMWTPPHFWALALARCDDYDKAGIPMLPSVAGKEVTRRQMLVYTLLLLPASLLPYSIGMSGIVYLFAAALLGTGFLFHALRVYRTKSDQHAMKMFAYSILYLFGIFAFLVLDRLVVLYA